jgi:isopentenyldiphosphate isomerase
MTEQIIIVNDLDKVIGYKERDELTSKDIYRVSVLWIINSKGEILLAKRALTKKSDPDKWGSGVAGTIAKGETYFSNIMKEAKEELGLTNIYPVRGEKERIKNKDRTYFRQWYHISINKEFREFKLDKNEVSQIKWFKKDELLKEIKKNPKKFTSGVKKILEE